MAQLQALAITTTARASEGRGERAAALAERWQAPLVSSPRAGVGVVLDGTLGLGQDALVAAAAVGPMGRVVGFEGSLGLAAFVDAGLDVLPPPWPSAPIEVRHGDVREVLAHPTVFDVVVLDPMFTVAKRAHPSFALLRRLAVGAPLDAELVALARRRARRSVVVKVAHRADLDPLAAPFEFVRATKSAIWAATPGLAGGRSLRWAGSGRAGADL